MQADHDPMRRNLMAAVVAWPLASASAATAATRPDHAGSGSRALVAYFSRSGNTRVVVGQLHRMLATDLFEILPARPYPEDYAATVEQATRERDSGFEPALAGRVTCMADYDTLFLGFPIWGMTAPPVIRAFLRAHDLSGKTLIPFIRHGGYGLGNSLSLLASHAPCATLGQAFVMEGDQERTTIERVNAWMKGSGISDQQAALPR